MNFEGNSHPLHWTLHFISDQLILNFKKTFKLYQITNSECANI